MGIIGFSAGMIVSAGVIALITSVGVLPRLAGKTHTARHIRVYETCITIGGTLGVLQFILNLHFGIGGIGGYIISGIFGIFAGIFTGCLATALAETLNTTAIYSRRIKLVKGIGFIVLSLALGKALGAILQFSLGWVYGG